MTLFCSGEARTVGGDRGDAAGIGFAVMIFGICTVVCSGFFGDTFDVAVVVVLPTLLTLGCLVAPNEVGVIWGCNSKSVCG